MTDLLIHWLKVYRYNIRLVLTACQANSWNPDPPSAEFAGDSRRRVRSRTNVLQVPANTEDPVKSADPKGHTVLAQASLRVKAPAANIEEKKSIHFHSGQVNDICPRLTFNAMYSYDNHQSLDFLAVDLGGRSLPRLDWNGNTW